MGKQQFLEALRQALKPVPEAEIEKTVLYYSEMIDDRMEDGRSEEEAIAGLEDISTIAQRVKCDLPLNVMVKAKAEARGGLQWWHVLLLIMGFPLWFPLGLALLSVVLSFYIVIWSLIVSLFAVVFSIGLSGIFLLISTPVAFIKGGVSIGLLILGAALILMALSMFFFFPVFFASKGLVKFTVFVGRKMKGALVK